MFSRACRLTVAALSIAASAAACDAAGILGLGDDPRATPGRQGANILIAGRAADAIKLEPGRSSDNESTEIMDLVFDKLLHYEAGGTELEPGLATAWEVSDDGRTWTFHLRRGVRFHDGTPLNADAVVFSLERQRDPRHPFHRPDFDDWSNQYRNVERVERVDEHTVRIVIERTYTPFLANMAMFPVAIVSPAAVEASAAIGPDHFADHPVGTGPFKLADWQKGRRIVLERNEAYWGGAPEVRRLIFEVMPDPRQRLISLESGAIDIAYTVPPEEAQFVALHPTLRLVQTPANNVSYLAMNTQRPPFDDVRVRRAVNHAINKAAIVKLAYQNLAIPADGPLPPTQWGYHAVRQPYTYDPPRARALLAEAAAEGRYAAAHPIALYVPSTPRPYLPDPEQIARVIQANLEAVGMTVELHVVGFDKLIDQLEDGVHDACLLGWVPDNGDPDNYLYTLFSRDNTEKGSARNVAFFRDAEVQGLLVVAQESTEQDVRERYYAKVQELISAQAPWAPLAHSRIAVAARDDIAGLVINASGHIDYKSIRRAGPGVAARAGSSERPQ